jgi:hypothetical protein
LRRPCIFQATASSDRIYDGGPNAPINSFELHRFRPGTGATGALGLAPVIPADEEKLESVSNDGQVATIRFSCRLRSDELVCAVAPLNPVRPRYPLFIHSSDGGAEHRSPTLSIGLPLTMGLHRFSTRCVFGLTGFNSQRFARHDRD